MQSFLVKKTEEGGRLDKYLKKLLPAAGNGFLHKMLRKKNITLNGKKADGAEKLTAGDEITLFLSDETIEKFSADKTEFPGKICSCEGLISPMHGKKPEKILPELSILYEDDDILIINKPAGLLSQKAKDADISANELIRAYVDKKNPKEAAGIFRPAVCNRLDRNTSGILLAGKTAKGLRELSAALKDRQVKKYYHCIVIGEITEEIRLSGRLSKEERTNRVTVYKEKTDVSGEESGKQIELSCRPIVTVAQAKGLLSDMNFTLLEVLLITGRTHQIRAQLAAVGRPVLGDYKYGERAANDRLKQAVGVNTQLLHAYRIEFPDGRVITAPYGAEWERTWQYLSTGALSD